MKRNPRKVKWTKAFRKSHGKELAIVSPSELNFYIFSSPFLRQSKNRIEYNVMTYIITSNHGHVLSGRSWSVPISDVFPATLKLEPIPGFNLRIGKEEKCSSKI